MNAAATPLQSLSIVVPAYDEALRLGRTLAQVLAFADAHLADCELIVVDDCSRDSTAAVAAATATSPGEP